MGGGDNGCGSGLLGVPSNHIPQTSEECNYYLCAHVCLPLCVLVGEGISDTAICACGIVVVSPFLAGCGQVILWPVSVWSLGVF